MKKILLYSGSLMIAIALWSCSESKLTDYHGERYVQFHTPTKDVTTRTFIYDAPGVVYDVLELRVNLRGELPQAPVSFDLVQVEHIEWIYRYDEFGEVTDSIPREIRQAEEGVHYFAPEKSEMVFEAGAVSAVVELVLHRDESLAADPYYLRLRVVPGNGLVLGHSENLENLIIISDKLERPSNWREDFFGKYSRVKHRFMIDKSGSTWNEEFIDSVLSDLVILSYYSRFFNAELEIYEHETGFPLVDENNETVTYPVR